MGQCSLKTSILISGILSDSTNSDRKGRLALYTALALTFILFWTFWFWFPDVWDWIFTRRESILLGLALFTGLIFILRQVILVKENKELSIIVFLMLFLSIFSFVSLPVSADPPPQAPADPHDTDGNGTIYYDNSTNTWYYYDNSSHIYYTWDNSTQSWYYVYSWTNYTYNTNTNSWINYTWDNSSQSWYYNTTYTNQTYSTVYNQWFNYTWDNSTQSWIYEGDTNYYYNDGGADELPDVTINDNDEITINNFYDYITEEIEINVWIIPISFSIALMTLIFLMIIGIILMVKMYRDIYGDENNEW